MKKFFSAVAVVAVIFTTASVASACVGYSYVGGDVSSSLYGGVSDGALYADSYYGGSTYAYTPTGTVYAGMSVQNSIGANTDRHGSANISTSGGAGFSASSYGDVSTWSGASASANVTNGASAVGYSYVNTWVQR